jgi:hypothetical protein
MHKATSAQKDLETFQFQPETTAETTEEEASNDHLFHSPRRHK